MGGRTADRTLSKAVHRNIPRTKLRNHQYVPVHLPASLRAPRRIQRPQKRGIEGRGSINAVAECPRHVSGTAGGDVGGDAEGVFAEC